MHANRGMYKTMPFNVIHILYNKSISIIIIVVICVLVVVFVVVDSVYTALTESSHILFLSLSHSFELVSLSLF